jgi:hypothetical protein
MNGLADDDPWPELAFAGGGVAVLKMVHAPGVQADHPHPAGRALRMTAFPVARRKRAPLFFLALEPSEARWKHTNTVHKLLQTSPLELHPPRMATADPRFNEFILFQAQNAGLFLGQIPHPATGERGVNLRAAKSVLDSLEMLAAKTAGNLTGTEQKLLTTALANLGPLYDKAAG